MRKDCWVIPNDQILDSSIRSLTSRDQTLCIKVVAMDVTSNSMSERKCLALEKLQGELSSILDKTRLLRLRKYSISIRRPKGRKQLQGQFRIEVSPTMPFLGTIISTPSSPKNLSSRTKTGEGPETALF